MEHNTKKCFVIAPIGAEDSETRKRSDQVLKHIIVPSVQKFGYKSVRADQIPDPGIITAQVIQHILDHDLVIADLTDKNPNVFYELALRHISRKPLIQLIRKGESIPFDIAATRIIAFDLHDPDSVADTKMRIEDQINAIQDGNKEFDNPVSVALDIQELKTSKNPEQQNLAKIIEAITELRGSITSIDTKLSYPEGIFPRDLFDNFMQKLYRSRSMDDGFALYERIVSDFSSIRESLQNKLTKENSKREIARTVQEDVIQKLENIQYKLKDFLITGGRYYK